MGQNTVIDTTERNAALDAVTANLNGGTIEIYTGTQPAGPGTAITSQTLLATLTLSATAFAAASGGSAAANTITPGTAVATGTAAWARWKSSGGTPRMDCAVGWSSSGAWAASHAYSTGDRITNDSGKVYYCATAGTSASSGGPTGTGTGITDGTAVWNYLGVSADLNLINPGIGISVPVSVSSYTLTHPA